jgi:quercetin dioxygenase-like cupin family protein
MIFVEFVSAVTFVVCYLADKETNLQEIDGCKIIVYGSGGAVSVAGDKYIYLITGDESGGAYALFEVVVSPNGGPPPHIHHREDESFYVMEGQLEFSVNGKTVKAAAGTFLHLHKGSLHTFKNGSNPARLLVQVSPAGLEKFFDEVGHPLKDRSAPAIPVTPAEIEKILAVAPKYGIEIKLPQ